MALSDIGVELLKIDALRSLEHVRDLEAKRNKALAELDRPPERLFFTAAEFEAAIAAAAPAKPEKPKYHWSRGSDHSAPAAVDGFDADADMAAWKATLPAELAKTRYGKGFLDGLAIGRRTFDPRFVAAAAREARRREQHASSPEGRAERAWCAMLGAANELLKDKGGAAALLAMAPPAVETPAEPVVVATAEGVLRARAIAAGQIVEMPRRRGEKDKL